MNIAIATRRKKNRDKQMSIATAKNKNESKHMNIAIARKEKKRENTRRHSTSAW